MDKKILAIIGDPISHSLSPKLHNYWFNKYKIDAKYKLLNIKETEIKDIVDKIKNGDLYGINITLPYKQKIIPFVSKMINDSEESNSVNTIYLNKDKQLIGENTDVYGFQAAYLSKITDSESKNYKILIMGSGGVTPSIIVALRRLKLNNISVTNRTYEKSLLLKKKFPNLKLIKWNEKDKYTDEFDIIVNATSLGLKNGPDFDTLIQNYKKSLIYIDTIYNPLDTKMIKHFKKNNIKTYNGLDMFVYQGQKSFYLWHKIKPEINNNLIELLK